MCISGFVTIVYIINSIWKGKLTRDSLVNVFANFFSVASIMSGFSLVFHTIVRNKIINDPLSLEDSELAYTIIGGFAVVWLALWELIKQFKEINA